MYSDSQSPLKSITVPTGNELFIPNSVNVLTAGDETLLSVCPSSYEYIPVGPPAGNCHEAPFNVIASQIISPKLEVGKSPGVHVEG